MKAQGVHRSFQEQRYHQLSKSINAKYYTTFYKKCKMYSSNQPVIHVTDTTRITEHNLTKLAPSAS